MQPAARIVSLNGFGVVQAQELLDGLSSHQHSYPNLKSVKDLIYKKGLAKVEKQRVPMTGNNIIELELGKYGILCIEDVNEIATVGPHFKEVTGFLCPFSLNRPEKALHGKKQLYEHGGDSGNCKDHINELIRKMN